jgi:GNAT superfamily N-acetyltransferase
MSTETNNTYGPGFTEQSRMALDDSKRGADPAVVQAWITGWALARETVPPVEVDAGYRVDVGWPRQRARFVFPRCCPGLQRLAETIEEPWILLKVCAGPDAIRPWLPPRWVIQPQGFMMTHAGPCGEARPSLPQGYSLDMTKQLPVPMATIRSADGELAASGRVAIVRDFAIYDRIETHPDHRRRGLGSAIVRALAAVARMSGATRGVLVATQDGRELYQALDWQLYSLYTTAVIPDHGEREQPIAEA